MTPLLASGITHLVDYEILGPYFTAHHALLLMAGGLMVGMMWFVVQTVKWYPSATGLTSLVEIGLGRAL